MAAIIVEPRNHAALEKVVKNVKQGLDIPVTIFHGRNNRNLSDAIARRNPGVRLREMPVSNLNSHSYSDLLLQHEFWDEAEQQSEGKNVLIFQTDAGLCNPENVEKNRKRLSELEEYDIVGAPGVYRGNPFNNGGFALRNPKTMKQLLKESGKGRPDADPDWLSKWSPEHKVALEDHWFSNACTKSDTCRVGNGIDADAFSCCTHESRCAQIDNLLDNDGSLFGFHAWNRGVAGKGLCAAKRDDLCPFANEIADLQRVLTEEELLQNTAELQPEKL